MAVTVYDRLFEAPRKQLAQLLGVLVRTSITRPLQLALAIARKIAAGQFDLPPHERFDDEPGRLLTALVAILSR